MGAARRAWLGESRNHGDAWLGMATTTAMDARWSGDDVRGCVQCGESVEAVCVGSASRSSDMSTSSNSRSPMADELMARGSATATTESKQKRGWEERLLTRGSRDRTRRPGDEGEGDDELLVGATSSSPRSRGSRGTSCR